MIKKYNNFLNESSDGKITINGIEYLKQSGSLFFYNVKSKPAVVCTCGNTSFEISYGEWECIAHCTKCGEQDSVYSG